MNKNQIESRAKKVPSYGLGYIDGRDDLFTELKEKIKGLDDLEKMKLSLGTDEDWDNGYHPTLPEIGYQKALKDVLSLITELEGKK